MGTPVKVPEGCRGQAMCVRVRFPARRFWGGSLHEAYVVIGTPEMLEVLGP